MAYYKELDRYIKNIPAEELNQIFVKGEYTKAFLMRTIIMNEKEHYIQGSDSRTLRGVWYSVVKPTLDKLGLLEASDQTEDGLKRWDATLSRYMGDLLRKGYLMYSDLGIEDVSRRKSNPSESYFSTNTEVYGYKTRIAPYANIIIATEKDTVYNIINQMADIFGVSCISAKGQNALGAMELLIKNIVAWGPTRFDTIYILSMTDYDPAGYYIAGALEKQVKDILVALGRDYIKVKSERIGIEPNQLDNDMVIANMYTPKPANLQKWFDTTGGINGQKKGLELDALEANQIRQIFVENIAKYIDEDKYYEFVKKSYIKEKYMDAMERNFELMSEEFENQVEDYVTVNELDIFDLAKRGHSYVPIWSSCSGLSDEDLVNEAIDKSLEKVCNK